MKRKIEIAKMLRDFLDDFNGDEEYKKLFEMIYLQFVAECIVKGSNTFKIKVKQEYVKDFPERFNDWKFYVLGNAYKFYLTRINPKRKKTTEEKEFISTKIEIPEHQKINKTPNEYFLEDFLNQNGLEIFGKRVYEGYILYAIAIS